MLATGTDNLKFLPLIQSGRESGLTSYSQLVQRNFFGGSQLVLSKIPRMASTDIYTIAAQVTGYTYESKKIVSDGSSNAVNHEKILENE